MKNLTLSLLGLAVVLGASAWLVAQPRPNMRDRLPSIHGQVVQLPREKLERWERPVAAPSTVRPPDRDGGQWHWHVNHGWVHFQAVQQAPLILPAEYVLPAQVNVIDLSVQACVTSCPHCGRAITLQVGR